MKDEPNCSYDDGGDAYLLQSVAINFNHTVVVKLHSYKDSDVGNLCEFKYFNKYFRHSRNARHNI